MEEDPCARFVDYTNATPWEEFVAAVEQQLRHWKLADMGQGSGSSSGSGGSGSYSGDAGGVAPLAAEIKYESRQQWPRRQRHSRLVCLDACTGGFYHQAARHPQWTTLAYWARTLYTHHALARRRLR